MCDQPKGRHDDGRKPVSVPKELVLRGDREDWIDECGPISRLDDRSPYYHG